MLDFNHEKLTVDLYIRVSTDRQANEGDSLEEQESELRKFCDYRGYTIHNILIDKGKSGGNTNRPEYQKLITHVKAKKINAVVVKKLDRLSRSLLDFEHLMGLLQENEVDFISLRESFDTTSAMGKAMLRVALVFAQLEREQTSERLIDVLEYRASQGLYNGGTRPFGYSNVNKELVPYQKEKRIIQTIFEKFLETRSITETARFLNTAGFLNRNNNKWDRRQVHKILQYPVYIGKVKWKTNLYDGIHQPIISEKMFYEAQHIIDLRRIVRTDSVTSAMLQSLIYCGSCKSPMTPSHSIGKSKKKYFYYRCTSTQSSEKPQTKCLFKYINMHKLEKQFIELLVALAYESQFVQIENQIFKYNQDIYSEINIIGDELNSLKTKLETVKSKKDKYLDSLISGSFDGNERKMINRHINEMDSEEKAIRKHILKAEFEINVKQEELIDITGLKQLLISFKANHSSMTDKEVKSFTRKNIKKVIYYPDQLEIQFRHIPWLLGFPVKY